MQFVAAGKPLELRHLETPKTVGRGVLVKVEVAGVCHSDIHLISGYYDLGNGKRLSTTDRGIRLPVTLGHEISGKVAEIGTEAETDLINGDSVIVYPWLGCGSCRKCKTGKENQCEVKPNSIGIFQDGGYAEYVLVPDAKYLINSKGLDPSQSAPLACSGITAYSAVKKCELGPNDFLVIIGVGGLGSTALQLVKKTTKARVAVLDIDDTKLALAAKLGADHVLNTRDLTRKDAVSGTRAFNSGLSADGVIDFVGNPTTTSLGFQLLGREGRLVLVGLFGGSVELPLPLFPLRGAGILGNFTGTLQDLIELTEFARKGLVSPIVSQTFELEEVNLALEKLEQGKIEGRAVIKF